MASWLTSIRKSVYGLTDAQDYVREATNNEQWGPTTKQHQQIVQFTFHYQECKEVMTYLYKRLGEDGKNWREIYKSLLVLDNILKNGSEEAVNIALSRVVEVKTLQSFQKIDEDGKDVGINIRERSKQIVELLSDNEYLKQARITAKNQKKDYGGVGNYGGVGSTSYGNTSNNPSSYGDDFDSFNKPSSSSSYNTYGGYSDEPKQSYDGPGSYKDDIVEQKQIERGPSPVSQVMNSKPTQQPNLFDFDAPTTQQKPLETKTNLFDMLGTSQTTQQQKPVQQSNSSDMFWSQPSQTTQQQKPIQQSTSTSLFDFATPQPVQQKTNTVNLFGGYANQPAQQRQPQPNTMDLFATMATPVQQPQPVVSQQPSSNDFDFGDFSSAQPQQKKSSDWRANIKIDSLDDKRKQQTTRQPSQQKQTLGQFY